MRVFSICPLFSFSHSPKLEITHSLNWASCHSLGPPCGILRVWVSEKKEHLLLLPRSGSSKSVPENQHLATPSWPKWRCLNIKYLWWVHHICFGFFSGGWCPSDYDQHPYLQIDLRTPHTLTSISTQGANSDYQNRMQKFRLSYSYDNRTWYNYTINGSVEVGLKTFCVLSPKKLRDIRSNFISIGNHMISSAIWNKYARVNFSKTNKIARTRKGSAICCLWKFYKCLFIPNCTRKIMWLLINNMHKKMRDG